MNTAAGNKFADSFIKNISLTTVGTFSTIFFGFLGVMVSVRIVSKEEFGVFFLLMVIDSFFVVLGDLGIDLGIMKVLQDIKKKEQEELINTVIFFKIAIFGILAFITFSCKFIMLRLFDYKLLADVIDFLPIIIVSDGINVVLTRILQGQMQFKRMAMGQIVASTLRFMLILIFLIFLKLSVLGLIYALIISNLVWLVYQYFAIPIEKRFCFNKTLLNRLLRFGFPLQLNNFLSFFMLKLDTLMIGAMVGPVGVAYYEVALKIPEKLQKLFQSFVAVYFPNISKFIADGERKMAESLLNSSLLIISFLTVSIGLIFTLFREEIIRIFFTDVYLIAAWAFSLLTLRLILRLNHFIFGYSLVALGYSSLPVKINTVIATTNILGNLFLIPSYGFIGAVYATLISECLAVLLNFGFLIKKDVHPQWIYFIKPIFIAVGIFCISHFFDLKDMRYKLLLIGLFFLLSIILMRELLGLIQRILLSTFRFRAVSGIESSSIEAFDKPVASQQSPLI